MIENVWLACVLAQSGVASLIGTRMYPVPLPQAPQHPCISYQVISAPRDYTQDGADGVTTYRIQMNCYGSSYRQVVQLKNALEASLSGMHGVNFGSPEMRVQGVFIDNEQDIYSIPLDNPGPRQFGKRLDFMVTISELL